MIYIFMFVSLTRSKLFKLFCELKIKQITSNSFIKVFLSRLLENARKLSKIKMY